MHSSSIGLCKVSKFLYDSYEPGKLLGVSTGEQSVENCAMLCPIRDFSVVIKINKKKLLLQYSYLL